MRANEQGQRTQQLPVSAADDDMARIPAQIGRGGAIPFGRQQERMADERVFVSVEAIPFPPGNFADRIQC